MKTIFIVIIILSIFIIGSLDYMSGSELSFSLFYLIPISAYSIHNKSQKIPLILFCFLSSIIWYWVEFNTVDYSNILYPIWNAIVRLSIFISIGLLLYNLKTKNQKIKSLNTSLEIINNEKNKFIGIAAHDLKNPIGGVFSFSDLLLTSYPHVLNDDVKHIVTIIKNASENALNLIKNLLDISKIESGTISISLKPQEYISFLLENIELYQIIANKKNIRIEFESTIKNIELKFDKNYLPEVIQNLLSNAIKFSYKDSKITVRVIQLENIVRTEIIDSGKGIAENEHNLLFNYFQKTNTTPTDNESSTGLGLAIAKRIMIEHYGIIGVSSKLNEGSTFYFDLPFEK